MKHGVLESRIPFPDCCVSLVYGGAGEGCDDPPPLMMMMMPLLLLLMMMMKVIKVVVMIRRVEDFAQ